MEKLLIITSTGDEHVDEAEQILQAVGFPYFRLDTDKYPSDCSLDVRLREGRVSGAVTYGSQQLRLEEVSRIWYRKPARPVISDIVRDEGHRAFATREAETSLEWMYQVLSDRWWLNHPSKMKAISSKLLQGRIAHEVGLLVPDTIVSTDPDSVKSLLESSEGKGAIKTLGAPAYALLGDDNHTIQGLYTKQVTSEDLKGVASVKHCPVLMQAYVQKSFELRVTIVGSEVIACAIYSQDKKETAHDWRHPQHVYDLRHELYELPSEVSRSCLRYLERCDLQFGAFDFVVTPKGEHVFIECNANGQWLWIEDKTQIRITEKVINFITQSRKESF